MAGNASPLQSIEKLKGIDNYSTWKFCMKMILIHEDLWDTIDGEQKGTLSDADMKKSQKALARICLSVQTSAFPHVRNAKDAREAWNNLSRAFEDKGLCRRLGLLRTLFSTKLSEHDSMESYLGKLQELSQQLFDINSPLDDEFLAVIMLSGLPSNYDPLIMALENSNLKLTSDMVKGKLLQEYDRRNKTEDTKAFAATRKAPKCYKCKRTGHFIKDCPRNNDKKPEKDKKTEKDKPRKDSSKALLTALSVSFQRGVWYVDSGASNHMCNNRELFCDFSEVSVSQVTVANGEKLPTAGQGNVRVKLQDCERTIRDVYYVPNLSANLLSVSSLVKKGYTVTFNKQKCIVSDDDEVLATATHRNGIYQLDAIDQPLCGGGGNTSFASFSSVTKEKQSSDETVMFSSSSSSKGTVKEESQEMWHRRLGHLNSRSMALMNKGMVTGIKYNSDIFNPCVACIEGKQTRAPFPKKSYTRATQLLGLVHTDLCGPMPTQSIGGARYFLIFIDDFSRKTFVYFLHNKDEVFEHFRNFKNLVENETNHKIKIIRSDNGGEFINYKLQAYLKENGIKHHTTVPYSPQQNGVAERANRTIVEKARCMLKDAGLDNKFWAEAVNTAVYLKNRTPTKALIGQVPEEKWRNKKVDVSHLRIFGCIAYAVTPIRNKLDSKSKQYVFVGYCESTKGFRLLDPDKSYKCVKARDVIFLENKFFNNRSHDDNFDSVFIEFPQNGAPGKPVNVVHDPESILDNDQCSQHIERSEPSQSEPSTVRPEFSDDQRRTRSSTITVYDSDSEVDTTLESNFSADPTYVPGCSTSNETTSDSSLYEDLDETGMTVLLVKELCNDDDVPGTVQEALAGTESIEWTRAMTDEYKSFNDNKCWTLVKKPNNQKPIKCRWVFKRKKGLNGELLSYKARLVAKGYSQKFGVDYEETFSPVVRHSTIRTLLAIAAEFNMDIDHLDVKTAFLNGNLNETVYMEQPEGFIVKGKENFVYKLHKAIYGLKQASKMWYERINEVLLQKMHFKRITSEPCVFYMRSNSDLIIIALYVDDILLFSSNSTLKEKVKCELMNTFEMKDFGSAHHILGMRVNKSQNKVTLDQTGYIKRVLEKFNMTDCKPAKTPLEKGIKLPKGDNKSTNSHYRNLLGCLMYIAVCTRPDIAHAVSVLSQFNECHTEHHWKALKRVLRYLKGTVNYGLVFQKSGMDVTAYVDADWGGNELDRKSFTGFIFKLGNSLISWESRKQKTVALSSTEAEYMALSDGCKEALFVRSFLNELLNSNCKVTLYNDNQSAQKLTTNCMYHNRTKHIDVRHHFIRENIKKNIVNVKYLSTDLMIADVLTKPLTKEKHDQFVNGLCLHNL